jgi:hypothetical protein
MTNKKISAWDASTTAPIDTDVLASVEGMGGTPAHKRKTIRTWLNGGWIPAAGTWAYASATTITVPAGATSIYSVGMKWMLTSNGVILRGYIIAVTSTLLTVIGDALTNYTFTANYYSVAARPVGFPETFAYTPTGISASNVSMAARFMISGRRCFVDLKAYFTGGITFTSMPTLPITASANYVSTEQRTSVSGTGGYNDANVNFYPNGIYPCVLSSATQVYIKSGANGTDMSATSPITWANGDYFDTHFSYEI